MERIRHLGEAAQRGADRHAVINRRLKNMKKLWTLGVALASVMVLSSCSTIDNLTGNISGDYQLRQINGATPPALVYSEPGYTEEVLSATFTLNSDGSYTDAAIIRETTNGRAVTSPSTSYGYYDQYNGEITFTEQGGRQYYGTVSSGRLEIDDQGLRMIYIR